MSDSGQDDKVQTMHAFISRALQKVLKEAPKKHTQLRQSCTTVLGERATHAPPAALPDSAHAAGRVLCASHAGR